MQLATRSKMFCACGVEFGAAPNTRVCPVCLGYPGALPVANIQAIRLTALCGLMLGSRVNENSKFDRKNYFYPDMPKNYQISQFDMPLCTGGGLDIPAAGGSRTVRINRIHIEEDVGKSMHARDKSSLDFNRAGTPLMEIVTEPDMESPQEAMDFLLAVKEILLYGGISRCNLEEGNIRCDINCSLRASRDAPLGVKTEIKNMNTFKGVFHALEHEILRQAEIIASGGTVVLETRRWNTEQEITEAMRSKEELHDYRYFPDPDLPQVSLAAAQIEQWRGELPELPGRKRERFVSQYGIPDYDAGVLASDRGLAEFFEKTAALSANAKLVSNWLMTDMLRLLEEKNAGIADARVTPRALAELVDMTASGAINMPTAREIFQKLFENGGDPAALVRGGGLGQISDDDALRKLVEEAVAANPGSADDYRAGKKAALQFLVGQVMRASSGKANPKKVGEILKQKLSG